MIEMIISVMIMAVVITAVAGLMTTLLDSQTNSTYHAGQTSEAEQLETQLQDYLVSASCYSPAWTGASGSCGGSPNIIYQASSNAFYFYGPGTLQNQSGVDEYEVELPGGGSNVSNCSSSSNTTQYLEIVNQTASTCPISYLGDYIVASGSSFSYYSSAANCTAGTGNVASATAGSAAAGGIEAVGITLELLRNTNVPTQYTWHTCMYLPNAAA